MRIRNRSLAVLLSLGLLISASVFAATKTYQVTGPVLEVSDTMIAVQKGKDRWEIARDASTKVTGDLKVGAKVTIEYRMTATAVDVKAEKATKKK
jgi:phosphate-selective porin